MEQFSARFKRMCAEAIEIQRLWPELERPEQEWDYYCLKGEYKDGFADYRPLVKLLKGDEKAFFENNIWLPQDFQIVQRLFPRLACGSPPIIENLKTQYSEYWRTQKAEPFLQNYLNEDERRHARALMFVMESWFNKEWKEESQKWVKIPL